MNCTHIQKAKNIETVVEISVEDSLSDLAILTQLFIFGLPTGNSEDTLVIEDTFPYCFHRETLWATAQPQK